MTEGDLDGAFQGLPEDAILRVYGDTQALLGSDPETAAARKVKWVRGLRRFAATVTIDRDGVSLDGRAATQGVDPAEGADRGRRRVACAASPAGLHGRVARSGADHPLRRGHGEGDRPRGVRRLRASQEGLRGQGRGRPRLGADRPAQRRVGVCRRRRNVVAALNLSRTRRSCAERSRRWAARARGRQHVHEGAASCTRHEATARRCTSGGRRRARGGDEPPTAREMAALAGQDPGREGGNRC